MYDNETFSYSILTYAIRIPVDLGNVILWHNFPVIRNFSLNVKDAPHFAGGDERPAGPALRAQRLALDEGGARRVRGGQGLRRAERQPRRAEV